jgi:hypothetical protein
MRLREPRDDGDVVARSSRMPAESPLGTGI